MNPQSLLSGAWLPESMGPSPLQARSFRDTMLNHPAIMQSRLRQITSTDGYIDRYDEPIVNMDLFKNQLRDGNEETEPTDSTGQQTGASEGEATKSTSVEECGDWQPSSFPLVLYRMLSNASREGIDHIISWCSHGRAFQVHKREAFEAEVMTK